MPGERGTAMQGASEVQATRVTRPDGTWFIDMRADLGGELADSASRAGYRLETVTGSPVWGGLKVTGTI